MSDVATPTREAAPLLDDEEDDVRLAPGFSPKRRSHPSELLLPDKVFGDTVDSRLPTSLRGKTVAITGTTSGTGYWTALVAVRKGADAVLLLNRPSHRQRVAHADMLAAARGGTAVHAVDCDLGSFASVRAAAAEVARLCSGGLDVLANNAGIMAAADERTVDGFDVQMQTNHLSGFLLTKLLMPSMEAAAKKRGEARVVQHSSAARFLPLGRFPFGGKNFERSPRNSLGGNSGAFALANMMGQQNWRYNNTKLANPVFAMALHAKLLAKNSRVKSLVCEPGLAATSLSANGWQVGADLPIYEGVFTAMGPIFRRVAQSGADGACPLLMACFAEEAASGDFYVPKDQALSCCGRGIGPYVSGAPIRTVYGGVPREAGMETRATSPRNWAKLWEASERAIGEKFEL